MPKRILNLILPFLAVLFVSQTLGGAHVRGQNQDKTNQESGSDHPEPDSEGFVSLWRKAMEIHRVTFTPIHNKYEQQYKSQNFEQVYDLHQMISSANVSPQYLRPNLMFWTQRLETAELLEEAVNTDGLNGVLLIRQRVQKELKKIANQPVYQDEWENKKLSSRSRAYRELAATLQSINEKNLTDFQEKAVFKVEQAQRHRSINQQAMKIYSAKTEEQKENLIEELKKQIQPITDAYKTAKDEHRSQVKIELAKHEQLIEQLESEFKKEVLQLPVEFAGVDWSDIKMDFRLNDGFMRLFFRHKDETVRIMMPFTLYSKRIFPSQGRINPKHIRPLDPKKPRVDGKYLVRMDYKSKLGFEVNGIPLTIESFGSLKPDLREFVTKAVNLQLLEKIKFK